MTIIYDPPLSLLKIEVDRMGCYTVTRRDPSKGGRETESRYLQSQEDVELFRNELHKIPFLPSGRRNWAYMELINSQF